MSHEARLRALAARVADAFVRDAGATAALLVGSTATGGSDEWSDIDLILFYDAWPGATVLEAVLAALDPSDPVPIGGTRDGDVFMEQVRIDGVAVQVVHQTIEAWRETAAEVLDELHVESPTQKALSGLHAGLPLHGDDVIASLRSAAPYTDAVRVAMVRANLGGLFPLWIMQDALAVRDAELWQRGELVTALQKVLGLLAGVHRIWFSTFQLKHVRALVESFGGDAPLDLARRIEAALVAPMPEAASILEQLVAETHDVVERAALPDVDVSSLRRQLGRRIQPWSG